MLNIGRKVLTFYRAIASITQMIDRHERFECVLKAINSRVRRENAINSRVRLI